MPRLSRAHEHAKRQINDLAAAGLPPKRLTIQIADTLEDAIGWDGYRMFGLDGQTLLINELLGASVNDAEARLEWLREVYLAMPTPYAELPELARRRCCLDSTALRPRRWRLRGSAAGRVHLRRPQGPGWLPGQARNGDR